MDPLKNECVLSLWKKEKNVVKQSKPNTHKKKTLSEM